MSKRIKRIISISLTTIFMSLTLLISFAVIRSNMTNTPPRLFNKSILMIVSSSMEPNIKKGDVIVMDYVDIDEIKVDDVITFRMQISGHSVLNTHRVIKINADGSFTTHGDNNPETSTETVKKTDVIGKYSGFRLIAIGNVISYLTSNPHILFIIIITLGIGFIALEIKSFVNSYIEAKKDEQGIK